MRYFPKNTWGSKSTPKIDNSSFSEQPKLPLSSSVYLSGKIPMSSNPFSTSHMLQSDRERKRKEISSDISEPAVVPRIDTVGSDSKRIIVTRESYKRKRMSVEEANLLLSFVKF